MAKVISDVDICNLSLSQISQTTINSIAAPKSDEETLCAKWYDTSRRSALAISDWNFAKGRFMCPKDTVDPAFGYDNQYILPADYLRLSWIGTTRQDFARLYGDYAKEGDRILINYDQVGALPISYIKDESLVAKMSPWFVDVFILKLALDISPEVNRSASEIQALEALLQKTIKSARELDGQESKVIVVSDNNVLTGRNKRLRSNRIIFDENN